MSTSGCCFNQEIVRLRQMFSVREIGSRRSFSLSMVPSVLSSTLWTNYNDILKITQIISLTVNLIQHYCTSRKINQIIISNPVF